MEPTEGSAMGRPTGSCSVCRKRKLRCNREHPCSNCLRSRSKDPAADCVYEETSPGPRHKRRAVPPASRRFPASPLPLSPGTSTSGRFSTAEPSLGQSSNFIPTATASQASSIDGYSFATSEVRRPEDRQSRLSRASSSLHSRAVTSPLASTEDAEPPSLCKHVTIRHLGGNELWGETQTLDRGIIHKARLFGQSHWISLIVLEFRDLAELIVPYVRSENSKLRSGLRKCKEMGQGIKSLRTPTWPTPITLELPARELADELLDAYLRTTETVYRVLHIPSFKRDYEALWLHGPGAPDRKGFLVQLKLVLAIGAITYDETFSLRACAIRWVYEAQTYTSEPQYKSRAGLHYMQTNILLLLARELVNVDGDSTWISAGALIRSAMHMGLHKDPAALVDMSRHRLAAEMRRRLWNTVLELALQASLASGKPPLVSLDDFDTYAPANIDDDHLAPEVDDAAPRPDGEFTQMTIALALRRTFPLRLAVAKILNDPHSQASYDQILRLDAELRGSYKEIMRALQAQKSHNQAVFSPFAASMLEVITHRYLASLHVSFLGGNVKEVASAYSRKVAVDSAQRIWRVADSSPPMIGQDSGSLSRNDDEYSRFTLCSSGFFRTATLQACVGVAVELKTQVQEDAGLGPAMLRPDLLAMLKQSERYHLKTIEIGETNIKAYVMACMIEAQIKGLAEELGPDELAKGIVRAGEGAVETCTAILEGIYGKASQAVGDARGEVPLDAPPEMAEDWGFLMSDFGADPMNWMGTDDMM